MEKNGSSSRIGVLFFLVSDCTLRLDSIELDSFYEDQWIATGSSVIKNVRAKDL